MQPDALDRISAMRLAVSQAHGHEPDVAVDDGRVSVLRTSKCEGENGAETVAGNERRAPFTARRTASRAGDAYRALERRKRKRRRWF